MSESVVNAGDVEESVTQVLTHFVQGGGEQAAMFLNVSPVCIYICLCWNKNEKGSNHALYAWKRVDDAGAGGPTFWILVYVTACIVEFPYYQPWVCDRSKSSELLTYLVVWHVQRVLSYLLTY